MKKRFPKWLYPIIVAVVVIVILGVVLVSHHHVRLNPVRTLDADEIRSIALTYTVPESGVLPNWQKELTASEEIADFVEQYNAVKPSYFGTLPDFITDPPESEVGSPSPSAVTARVTKKDGATFGLRVYLSMDEDERYDNSVLWVNSGHFFPEVETPDNGKVATRRFRCDRDSLSAFAEYATTLAKTGEYRGG